MRKNLPMAKVLVILNGSALVFLGRDENTPREEPLAQDSNEGCLWMLAGVPQRPESQIQDNSA
jgi:hypothetical protein